MRVGDLIREGARCWEVVADVPGAVGVEDGVILRAIDRKPPHDDEGLLSRIIVPRALLESMIRKGTRHYRLARPPESKEGE